FSRRALLVGAAAAAWAASTSAGAEGKASPNAATKTDASHEHNGANRIAALEKRQGGRLGVAVLDTATGKGFQHRESERFPLCSTFKYIAAAAILHRVDLGQEHLDRWMPYGEGDLLEYAPFSRDHVGEHGMRLEDACAAAVELSDNTAA